MARYILTDRYAFRGYKGLPYGLLDFARGTTSFMSEASYTLAVNCNGKVDMDREILPPVAQKILDDWLKMGYIRECQGDEKLDPIQEYKFYNARYKEAVHWSITGHCNYRCKHCFMSAPHALQGEPSFEDCVKMLDAFERCGIYNLHITGGEPLVRKDFWRLMDEVLLHGMGVQAIYTNGRLANDEFFDNLEKRYMNPTIQFSFDGVGVHDWMRGVKGAQDDVVEAFRRCRERGISFSCSMSLCKDNAPTIRETAKFLAEQGCSHLKIGTAYEQGEWVNQPEHFLSQAETYETFMEYIPQYFEDGCPIPLGLEGFFNYEKTKDGKSPITSANEKNVPDDAFKRVKMCGHVRKSMYVSPVGNVLPCMSMIGLPIEEKFPNMLETPLEEILDKDTLYMQIINYSISDYMAHNPECAQCEYKNACAGGCRAFAVRDDPNDYLAKDMWTCTYYKGGWMEKKNQLLKELSLK